jgi:Family of unknown function (DUF5681)
LTRYRFECLGSRIRERLEAITRAAGRRFSLRVSFGTVPANNRKSTGRFAPGHSGNPEGRQKGVPNKATQTIKEFARSVLENPKYREHLVRRAEEDKLAPHEFVMLHQYAYGKPKDTVAVEDQRRAPTQIVFLSDLGDPLTRPHQPKRTLPEPSPPRDEVAFTL